MVASSGRKRAMASMSPVSATTAERSRSWSSWLVMARLCVKPWRASCCPPRCRRDNAGRPRLAACRARPSSPASRSARWWRGCLCGLCLGAHAQSPLAQDPHAAARRALMAELRAEAAGSDAFTRIDRETLAVLGKVPRHAFVPASQRRQRLREPAAGDRLRADHLAALHRRADDDAGAAARGPEDPRDRHRLGIPGRGARRLRRAGVHRSRSSSRSRTQAPRSGCAATTTCETQHRRRLLRLEGAGAVRCDRGDRGRRRRFRRRWWRSSSPAGAW